jgi:hypothetical protein
MTDNAVVKWRSMRGSDRVVVVSAVVWLMIVAGLIVASLTPDRAFTIVVAGLALFGVWFGQSLAGRRERAKANEEAAKTILHIRSNLAGALKPGADLIKDFLTTAFPLTDWEELQTPELEMFDGRLTDYVADIADTLRRIGRADLLTLPLDCAEATVEAVDQLEDISARIREARPGGDTEVSVTFLHGVRPLLGAVNDVSTAILTALGKLDEISAELGGQALSAVKVVYVAQASRQSARFVDRKASYEAK